MDHIERSDGASDEPVLAASTASAIPQNRCQARTGGRRLEDRPKGDLEHSQVLGPGRVEPRIRIANNGSGPPIHADPGI